MTSEDAKAVTVRLGDHNLDDSSDAQSVEKSVKLIVKNKLFSMQTLVRRSTLNDVTAREKLGQRHIDDIV
jgi:hypothetical protein